MKLLLLGDTHCDQWCVNNAIAYAYDQGLDAIFQVGDFGFWPRVGKGRQFIKIVMNSLVPFYWLPGNHEDWYSYLELLDKTDDWDDDGFAAEGAMRVAPPSHTWQWDGMTFGSLGGAYSVDRSAERSVEGVTWFHEEVPQFEWIEKLPNKVDVLLTHEAPFNLAAAAQLPPLPAHWDVDWGLSNQSQQVIWKAVDHSNPSLVVHGHWHWRGLYRMPGRDDTTIVALDQASGASLPLSSVILDTAERTCQTWNQYLYEAEGTIWQS